MEFRVKRKRGAGRLKSEYPTNLQLYKVPPVETISLQEFEELAEQRHKRKWQISTGYQLVNLPSLVLKALCLGT
jgi:DNA primase large subunit